MRIPGTLEYPCQPFDMSRLAGNNELNVVRPHTFIFVGPSIEARMELGASYDSSNWRPVFGFPSNDALNLFFCAGQHDNEAMVRFNLEVLAARDALWNGLPGGRKWDALMFHAGMFHFPEAPFVILGPVTERNHDIIYHKLQMVPPSWRVEYQTNDIQSVIGSL